MVPLEKPRLTTEMRDKGYRLKGDVRRTELLLVAEVDRLDAARLREVATRVGRVDAP